MKNLIIIITLTFWGCDSPKTKTGQKLDQSTLWKTERFIPTNFGYNLLEITSDTSDIDAPRYLYLFDDKNTFLDGTRIYGTIQSVEKDKIEINKSMSGWTGESHIGNLKIIYTDIKRVSKGGGIDGSFIVDSIKYNKSEKTVTLFTRKPEEQFVLMSNEIENKNNEFTIQEITTVPIKDIDFSNHIVQITSWYSMTVSDSIKRLDSKMGIDKSGSYNSTKNYFFHDRQKLQDLFTDIEKNGL
jgi:hypothetical protein